MVIAKPGSITPHTRFKAEVYVLKKEEGGRHTPFHNNYRPQFYFRTTDVTGEVILPEGVEMVMPGDNLTIEVKLIAEIAMNKSLNQFDFLNKKLIQSARKKDDVIRSQITRLLNLIYPLSKPQERVFNFLHYYTRFGEKFIDTVYSQMDVLNHNHQIISLGEK